MSLYLVFNNFAQYFDMSEPTDCVEDIKAASNNSVEKPIQDTVADIQTILSTKPETTTFPKVEPLLENSVFTNDFGKTEVSASQTVPTSGLETGLAKTTAEERDLKPETGDVAQNTNYADFQSLLKKFEDFFAISLRLRRIFSVTSEKWKIPKASAG